MRLPVIQGVIDRRILVNYRVEAEALAAVLPAPFRPKLIDGFGIGGICLIRLREVRPRFAPRIVGTASENAAHRIAVECDHGREGVFITRRDTSSRLNAIAGGRLFPGVHHLADFAVREDGTSYSVTVSSDAGEPILDVRASVASDPPVSSVFGSLDVASQFFAGGSFGYSPSRQPGSLDTLELRTLGWHIAPLAVSHVYSSYFEDEHNFPSGSVQFDSAFLMRNVEHEWHAHAPLRAAQERQAG